MSPALSCPLSKAVARWVSPALLAALVGIIIWIGRTALTDIDDIKKIMYIESAKTSDFRTRMDNMVRSMDERDKRHDDLLSDHEKRLRDAEKKQRP